MTQQAEHTARGDRGRREDDSVDLHSSTVP